MKGTNSKGFAAIKVTALGNPLLLERMSTTIVEIRNLFLKFDEKQQGKLSKEVFIEAYDKYFVDGKGLELFNRLDNDNNGFVDYVEWTENITIEELNKFTQHCKCM